MRVWSLFWVSSWEFHRAPGVTQKTDWFMPGRIRLAMQDESDGGKLGKAGCGPNQYRTTEHQRGTHEP